MMNPELLQGATLLKQIAIATLDDLDETEFLIMTEATLGRNIEDAMEAINLFNDVGLSDLSGEDTQAPGTQQFDKEKIAVHEAKAYLAMHRLGCSFGGKIEGEGEEADHKQDQVLNKVTYDELTTAIDDVFIANEGGVRLEKSITGPLQYALATREYARLL
jgi:hypothetical protein